MSEFVKVSRTSDIPLRAGKFIRIEDEEIALFNVNGVFYAIDNVCPHQHISALHQGELSGLQVTCPMHGWTYSLETGKAESGNGRVRTHRVKVEHGFVWIEKPASGQQF
jgi:NAD(P)H-dependent nitrite reductase small subunit